MKEKEEEEGEEGKVRGGKGGGSHPRPIDQGDDPQSFVFLPHHPGAACQPLRAGGASTREGASRV